MKALEYFGTKVKIREPLLESCGLVEFVTLFETNNPSNLIRENISKINGWKQIVVMALCIIGIVVYFYYLYRFILITTRAQEKQDLVSKKE